MRTHDPVWFHVDMDAFYAAVEQRDHPEYRGLPVIVGAMPGTRGVVSTCSYEARACGVHSAMPIHQAHQLCPDGIYLSPRMKHYSEVSKSIMNLFKDFSPEVVQISIDEAFINMTGTENIFGSAQKSATAMKNTVRQASDLSISIGVAQNRLVAKMASEFQKPDGLTIVEKGQEIDFIRQLSLSSLWGVGKKTQKRLEELNISNIEQLLNIPHETLQDFFGRAGGTYLFQVIRGMDTGIYDSPTKSHSISNEHTFPRDCTNRQDIENVLFNLTCSIVFRLHREQASSRTLVFKLRLGDFSTSTRQKSVGHDIRTVEDCHALALQLLNTKWNGKTAIRLIGLGFNKVEKREGAAQTDLFDLTNDRRLVAETTVLELQDKYEGLRISKARNFIPMRDQEAEH